jgi:hypothetical protein
MLGLPQLGQPIESAAEIRESSSNPHMGSSTQLDHRSMLSNTARTRDTDKEMPELARHKQALAEGNDTSRAAANGHYPKNAGIYALPARLGVKGLFRRP